MIPGVDHCSGCGWEHHPDDCPVRTMGLRGAKPVSPSPHTIEKGNVTEYGSGARTEQAPFDLTQIPVDSLMRLAQVFKEGEQRYGRNNWRQGVGDTAWQLERANHAIKHLLYFVHWLQHGEYLGEDTPEHDLAKVMWFSVVEQELLRLGRV